MNRTIKKMGIILLVVMLSMFCGNVTESDGDTTNSITGDQTTYTVNGITFTMVYVEGGLTYMAGLADNGDKNGDGDALDAADEPGGTTVSDAYEIAKTEVTYLQWLIVYDWATTDVGGGLRSDGLPVYFFANAGTKGDNGARTIQDPVTTINWRDAMVWTNALTEYYNAQNGTSLAVVYTTDSGYVTPQRDSRDSATCKAVTPLVLTVGTCDNPYVNPDAKGFRLPTRDESGLASRYKGSDNWTPGSYASGATADNTIPIATGLVSWYSVNSGNSTHPVSKKTANTLGLYDMSGNVWEWKFDWHPDFVGAFRVNSGGSWNNTATSMQVGYLFDDSPYFETGRIGFRPARTP